MSLPMHQRVFQLPVHRFPSFSGFSGFSDREAAGDGGFAVGEDPAHVLLRKEHRGNGLHGPREFWRQGEDGELQAPIHAPLLEIVGGQRVVRQRRQQRPLPDPRGTALCGRKTEGFPASQDGNRGYGECRGGQRGEDGGAGGKIDLNSGQRATERRNHQRNSIPGLADAGNGHGGERREGRGGELARKKALAVEGIDPAAARRADGEDAERPQREELHGDGGEVAERGGERERLDLEWRAGNAEYGEIGRAEAEELDLNHVADEEQAGVLGLVLEERDSMRVPPSLQVDPRQALKPRNQRQGSRHRRLLRRFFRCFFHRTRSL